MVLVKLLSVTLLLIAASGSAQTNAIGEFGCSQDLRAAFYQTDLKFVELTSPDAIKQWKTRPILVFDGFDAAKYTFTRTEFYRWHVPVPGREGYDQGPAGDSTDRLALAVRVVGPRGERWFELANPEDPTETLLFIQRRDDNESNRAPAEPAQAAGSTPEPDEMSAWLTLQAATPDLKLPLFSLSYRNQEHGTYQVEAFDNHLLLDLRTGSPRIIKVLTCRFFEPIGGACSAQDEAWERHDTLQCQWEAASSDFHCTMVSPYGDSHAWRKAEKEFYLLSDKPTKPSYTESQNFLPDVGQLALGIRENPKSQDQRVIVSGLGPTTLLQHFKDLLPDTEVFVFASPGAGPVLNAHLSLVTVSSGGKLSVQTISKWGIAGEETDEAEAPKDLLPIEAQDSYHTQILEQRAGFRAFGATLTAQPGKSSSGHVLYWIGLEAVDGKLIASAVRLASDDYAYGGCGSEFHDSTATSIRKKTGMAEATLSVQGQFQYEYTNPYPTEGSNCVWTSVLHWKPGSGFRVRKLAEDCKASHREVKITDDGKVSSQAAPRSP
jgi:hypothetical protein